MLCLLFVNQFDISHRDVVKYFVSPSMLTKRLTEFYTPDLNLKLLLIFAMFPLLYNAVI